MRNRLCQILGVLLLLLPASLISQITVTGTVIDSQTKETLIGVNILIKGNDIGTITDFDGKYTLYVPHSDSTLTFSYVGYIVQDIKIGNRTEINLELVVDAQQLDEVVVVGYGTQKKSTISGAISVVSAEDMKEANTTSVAKALQGRTPGVNITSTSGAPGAAPSIRIRGVGSINSDAQPIVVIDGIVQDIGALNDLNPKDIESISVLKDAASAAIYGARSSNGVILVKTKSGKKGTLKVDYTGQITLATLPRQMDIMDAGEYREFYDKAYKSHNDQYGSTDSRVFPDAYTESTWNDNGQIYTNWQDLITNDYAVKNQNYLSISGGSEKSTYLLSANYVDEDGVLINSNEKLFGIRLNSEHRLGKRIKVGESMFFSKKDGRKSDGHWLTAVVASPLLPVYNKNAKGGFQGPDPIFTGINERTNPLAELELIEENIDQNNVNGNLYMEIDILKGLTFRTVYGFGFFNLQRSIWKPRFELFQRSNPTASLSENFTHVKNWQFDQILSYNTTINKHSFGLMAGHTAEETNGVFVGAAASDFRWESLQTVSNGNPNFNGSSQFVWDRTGESYFGRVTYDYAGKYLFTGTVRRDGSSQFGASSRYGVFPSFSLGWKLNEDFFSTWKWMDMLKARFSYGLNGNTPGGDYLYDTFISTYDQHVYTLGTDDRPVFGAAPYYNFGSPFIKWESAEIINYGLDFVGFNGKVEFYAEYYIKNQNDLITNLPLQNVYGLSNDANPPKVNLGDIQNSGVELNLLFRNRENKLKYELSFNLTTVKNRVEYIPSTRIFNDENTNIAVIGHSIGSYYGYVAERLLQESDFVQDSNGKLVQDETGRYTQLGPFQQDFTAPGDIKFTDLNQDGVVNASDQTIIGKVIPDMTYGVNIGLDYGMFDLNILLQGVKNVDLYNAYRSRAALAAGSSSAKDENKLREVQNYWTPENTDTDITRIGLGDLNNNGRISTWWLEDASFFRLRNMQLGFTMPKKITERFKMNNLRIYIGGENLLTFTKYKGYNPEISSTKSFGAVDYGTYPVPRFYQAGISASF